MKKRNLPKEESETYFVSLKNPLELRRQLLESSRKSIYSLQNYQKILLIREEKRKEFELLRENIKELLYLNKNFNSRLPPFDHTLLKDSRRTTRRITPLLKATPEFQKSSVPVERMQERSELEKLEDSLNSIEEKLKSLGQ